MMQIYADWLVVMDDLRGLELRIQRWKQENTRRTRGGSQNAAVEAQSVTSRPLKCCCTLYLQTEEWVSG
jgi:hypothetical protein